MGLTRISFTFTCSGAWTANNIASAMSVAFRACIFFAAAMKPCNDSSVMVFSSSVSTAPGSMHVTRMFERTLSS